jgi:hypothetical protein
MIIFEKKCLKDPGIIHAIRENIIDNKLQSLQSRKKSSPLPRIECGINSGRGPEILDETIKVYSEDLFAFARILCGLPQG